MILLEIAKTVQRVGYWIIPKNVLKIQKLPLKTVTFITGTYHVKNVMLVFIDKVHLLAQQLKLFKIVIYTIKQLIEPFVYNAQMIIFL